MTRNAHQYVSAAILQDYFVDKDSGAPLSGGVVTLWQDTNRLTILKNWYYQTGSPGAYTYIPLPNPMTLSSVGTIQVNGQDVIPFFYPYVEDGSDTIQLYYVTVYNSNNVLQFTREGFPFVSSEGSGNTSEQELENLIPNGQFAAHTNIAPVPGLLPGQLSNTSDQSYTVAPGGYLGWNYIRSGSIITDTDFVNFNYITNEPDNLPANPRYSIDISCTNATGSCTAKTLGVTFSNVNHFQGPNTSEQTVYNFSFWAQTNAPIMLDILILYNFGTGGSTELIFSPQSWSVGASGGAWTIYQYSFTFPLFSGETIGPNDDDYVGIGLSFPVASGDIFNVSFTNFALTIGAEQLTTYPERPDNIVFGSGIAGSGYLPAADGSDLYLPMIYTPRGLGFDTTAIGKIYASDSAQTSDTELQLNGNTYIGSTYSEIGIPYSRLQNYYLNNGYQSTAIGGVSYQIPQYGTGPGFVTAFVSPNTTGNGSYLYISSNSYKAGVVAVTNGATSSGFTIPVANDATAPPASNPNLLVTAGGTAVGTLSYLMIRSLSFNTTTSPSANPAYVGAGSAFTVNVYKNNNAVAPATSGTPIVFSLTDFSATLSDYASKGLSYTAPNSGGGFYFYYKVNGTGTDPAPGGFTLLGFVNIVTGDTVTDIIYKTACFFQGGFISGIQAPTSPTPGGYFTWSAGGVNYGLFFKVNGAGSAPILPNTTVLECDIPSGIFTAPQIAAMAAQTINTYSYAVPNLQGMTLRGLDPTTVWDADALSRTSFGNNVIVGAQPGTLEYGIVESHQHATPSNTGASTGLTGGANASGSGLLTFNSGGAETRPVNISVNWVTRY